MNSFEQFINENRNSLNIYAKEYIENLEIPELLKESIIYSLVNDGKKIRPLSFLYLLKFYNIDYKEYFIKKVDSLEANSPINILKKGYSITYLNDNKITSVKSVNKNDNIFVRLSDGLLECNVIDTIEEGVE